MNVMEHCLNTLIANQLRCERKLLALRDSLDIKFIWIVSTMIAFGSALLWAMAKGFHWLG